MGFLCERRNYYISHTVFKFLNNFILLEAFFVFCESNFQFSFASEKIPVSVVFALRVSFRYFC